METLTDRRNADRREVTRESPGRRAEDFAERVRLCLGDTYFGSCHALYPSLWQPTDCTLQNGHGGDYHVDERRGIRWAR